ncbi:MAG: hypothetical protein ABIN67_24705 [Ferruginibacter sp.]
MQHILIIEEGDATMPLIASQPGPKTFALVPKKLGRLLNIHLPGFK